jgi:hypothetical protein
MQGLGYAHSAPHGVTLPKDAVRWEANHVENERQQARKQRWWQTPSEPESSGDGDEEVDEDEEEGQTTRSLPSSPPKVLPLFGDLFSQQAGISVGTCRAKRPRAGTGASFGPLPQSGLVLVDSDLQGMSICTRGDRNTSLAWGFVGFVVLIGRRGYCIRAGGPVLPGHRGCGAVIQEGPPLVLPASVLPVCVWSWLLVLRHSRFSRF